MPELLEFLRAHDEAFRSHARLSSLYSDFRYQLHSNPDGYAANVSTWLRGIAEAARAGDLPADTTTAQSNRLVLKTGDALARSLQTPEFGRPLALGAVIDEGIRDKRLVKLSTFLDPKWSLNTKSWIPSVGQVLGWGLKQLGVGAARRSDDHEDRITRGEFVIVANVEEVSDVVISAVSKTTTSHTARIFSKELFAEAVASATDGKALSSSDLKVLLTYLSRDRAVISHSSTFDTIKFRSPEEAHVSPISDEDVSVASLRTLIHSLEPQIERLTARVAELDRSARDAVAKKQSTAAKTALRSKKLTEATLAQRSATLAQIEEIYSKIEQAVDQVEIVRVMESSSRTLKTFNERVGGVERVQDVVEELRERMMDVDEIGQAMNEVSAGTIDEGEVDDELEALEAAELEKKVAAEKKQREKQEEVEAEATRLKLAQLDQMGEKAKAEQTVTPPNEPMPAFGDQRRNPENEQQHNQDEQAEKMAA